MLIESRFQAPKTPSRLRDFHRQKSYRPTRQHLTGSVPRPIAGRGLTARIRATPQETVSASPHGASDRSCVITTCCSRSEKQQQISHDWQRERTPPRATPSLSRLNAPMRGKVSRWNGARSLPLHVKSLATVSVWCDIRYGHAWHGTHATPPPTPPPSHRTPPFRARMALPMRPGPGTAQETTPDVHPRRHCL